MGGASGDFGFAPTFDSPVPYMERTRNYYRALGYGAPYEWAHYVDVPFHRLSSELSASRVALVTTAAPYRPDKGDQSTRAYNAAAKFFTVYSGDVSQDHDLRISHIAIDRKHTTGEDSATYFPLAALRKAAAEGRIGSLAPRFHGVPTNRSQRVTIDTDGPEVLRRCLAEEVDAAILVANCPVCHQTLALVARLLELNGISTVVLGCAKDIVEHVGVPRFLFSDFPLGNAAGRPRDPESQTLTMELALRLLEAAPAPRTTVQSPVRWSDSADWKLDYCNIERMTPEELARRRSEFDTVKEEARRMRAEAGLLRP
ncbi:MAG TPA: glycine/sarcosine/betaine reductase selenoprotein B family protein [Alphaproteobacteria bacterium]|nr:glycine/sarcosine/betaine reductase selenoprotein B family protein [Alphaproteobacteria bacterium]